MNNILVKVHESYRMVVAVCDEDAGNEIVRCSNEDATFNFVGEKSVGLAKELGIVKSEGVMDIDGVPFALVLL